MFADVLNHVGQERIEKIAREVASVDLDAIDVREVVWDPELKPLAPQLVDGNWPEWDLELFPEYVRRTRGERDGSRF